MEELEEENECLENMKKSIKRALVKAMEYLGTLTSGLGVAYILNKYTNEDMILNYNQAPIETTLKYEQDIERPLFPPIRKKKPVADEVKRGYLKPGYYKSPNTYKVEGINKHNMISGRTI